MYIDNDDFSVWMQKLYAKLEELCKDVRVLHPYAEIVIVYIHDCFIFLIIHYGLSID